MKVINSVFCKVCFDAGEKEDVYKSHYVKDNAGNVICPRLLKTECRYCKEKGHTVKFCEKAKQANKLRERYENERKRRANESTKVVEAKKKVEAKKNAFAILLDESDEEEENKEIPEVENMFVPKPTLVREPAVLSGWAAIAAKPKPIVLDLRNTTRSVDEKRVTQGFMEEEEAIMEEEAIPFKPMKRIVNWCDVESSDEEDEYYEEDNY